MNVLNSLFYNATYLDNVVIIDTRPNNNLKPRKDDCVSILGFNHTVDSIDYENETIDLINGESIVTYKYELL